MAKKKIKYIVPSPTQQLPELWKMDVFKTGRSLEVVIQEFEKIGFNFSPEAVSMALMRAPYLTRRGKKGGYTYIQIGPYKTQ